MKGCQNVPYSFDLSAYPIKKFKPSLRIFVICQISLQKIRFIQNFIKNQITKTVLRPYEIWGVRRSVVRLRSSGPLRGVGGSWLPSYAALTPQISEGLRWGQFAVQAQLPNTSRCEQFFLPLMGGVPHLSTWLSIYYSKHGSDMFLRNVGRHKHLFLVSQPHDKLTRCDDSSECCVVYDWVANISPQMYDRCHRRCIVLF